jgi:hypothetical protein
VAFALAMITAGTLRTADGASFNVTAVVMRFAGFDIARRTSRKSWKVT